MTDIVVVGGIRTPIGRFGGALKDVAAYDLGAAAILGVLKKTGLPGKVIDDVILGSCRQAGNGPNPSRTAMVRGGIPEDVPALTLNMACPSGMRALTLASQAIRLGEAQVVLVGGFDSMSTIPYLLKDARWQGFKMGDKVLQDGWSDSIDPLCNLGMGETAENLAEKYQISRREQDEFAASSHQKAARAQDEGWFDEEIVPVSVPQPKGDPLAFGRDETIRRDTTVDRLLKLPPVFRKDGSITAGNACQMSDGAVALVVTSRSKAKDLGVKPLFSLLSYAQSAVDPRFMGEGPAATIPLALNKAKMTLADIDFIEVNEAFAAQVLANERILKWDRERLNVHGGAIALGHPTGISGARILLTLYHILRLHAGETGLAGICGGGGVSMAAVVRREG
ncbi:MAG: acetyl-CoA acetyltransferase [Candidatus Aminicenantes bacterium RBG_16_63_16]|nr:MAG: acetyl-CoA acetyltransferase [Candidatus Aminicenantes bacterium RBG_16_63_16]